MAITCIFKGCDNELDNIVYLCEKHKKIYDALSPLDYFASKRLIETNDKIIERFFNAET